MLSIVVSTLEKGIEQMEKTVAFRHPAVRYLIVHQTRLNLGVPEYLQQRPDIKVVQSTTRGLAASRNIGLSHCQTQYALIADDDVEFLASGIIEMLGIIRKERPDFALFRIRTPDGQPEYKDYPDKTYRVKRLQHWVSSIEIVINVERLKGEGIRFDERFGLGTILDRGEEEIFVSDLIQSGLVGYYYPIPIVMHPYESSGKIPRSEKQRHFFQGAYDTRLGVSSLLHASWFDYLRHPDRILPSIYYYRGKKYIERTSRSVI